MIELPIEGVLHLSALAVVATSAYVGIDKLESGKDSFKDNIEEAAILAAEIAQKLALIPDGVDDKFKAKLGGSWTFGTLLPACVIYYAAKKKVPMQFWLRIIVLPYRFWQMPFLGYMRSRYHAYLAGIFCFGSIAIFLTLVGLPIWGVDWPQNAATLQIVYLFLVAALGCVFIHGIMALSYRGNRLNKKCHALRELINARTDKRLNEAFAIVDAFMMQSAAQEKNHTPKIN